MSVDMFGHLESIDSQLVAARFPAMSPFWRSTMKRWLRSKKRWFVGRVGRRGGKGVVSAKLAATFAVYCPLHNVTPGERVFVELLSVDKEEATARLGMIAKALEALGVPHKALGEEIQLLDPERPVTIRVRAASVRAVGGTAILILMDELARWRDAQTGVNPAREIFASIKAELLSQPEGRGCLLSAPFGEADLHSEKFDEGETESQCVGYAPTWIANPTISEQDTRELESNPAIWEREYRAVPSAHVTAIASKQEIAARVSKGVDRRARVPGARYLGTMDPSGLRNDSWVCSIWCLILRSGPAGEIVDVVQQVAMKRFAVTFWKKPTFDGCVAESLALFRDYNVTEVRTDGHFFEAIRPRFAEAGVTLVATKQTSPAITQRIESLQARIANGTIELLDDEVQTKELGGAQLVTHAGGRKTLRAPERKGHHDDCVSAILLSLDEDAVIKMPPSESDVVVRRGRVNFDPGIGLEVEPTKYFTRMPDGRLVQREPPYGSIAFIRYAVDQVGRGQWTPSIERWIAERGLTPAAVRANPDILDPAHEQRRLNEIGRLRGI